MKITDKQFYDIVTSYYDEIFRYCRRRVDNDHEAYDLTQEVFLALSQYYNSIEYKKIRQWLYNTAHNIVVDYYKMKKREATVSLYEHEDEAESLIDTSNEISDEIIDYYKSEILRKLSDSERKLYDSVYSKKIAYSEIARQYNISETALRKRISRLRKKIIAKIKEILEL